MENLKGPLQSVLITDVGDSSSLCVEVSSQDLRGERSELQLLLLEEVPLVETQP